MPDLDDASPRPLAVRSISASQHLEWIRRQSSVSFLQTPAWGRVKTDWAHESVGWFDADGALAGAALVLYRQVPHLPLYLAYVPEGPALPWERLADPASALAPLVDHVAARRAFALTIGPVLPYRRWQASTIKAALAAARRDPAAPRHLDQVPADSTNVVAERLIASLEKAGWKAPKASDGFAAGQPAHVFQLPLTGATEESLLAGFNQLWRRNLRRAEKEGVEVARGGAEDLAAFHAIYAETAERDSFTPRPLAYFERMWADLSAEAPERIALYLARWQGHIVAATIATRVGTHYWYSYGASTTAHREVKGSNAVQWAMMRDALAEGCGVYDLRGITDTLDPDDSHAGLIQFKVGTGGRAQSYPGEWTYPIRPLLYKAYEVALARR